jgi:hypothetical protein
MMIKSLLAIFCAAANVSTASGFTFLSKVTPIQGKLNNSAAVTSRRQTSLQMVDRTYSESGYEWCAFAFHIDSLYPLVFIENVLMGAGIAIAGLGAGIGLVAFTEAQGERAKQRGGGLSDDMSTRIAGQLLEDVEVSSVKDLGSLTSQLEAALKESGGADEKDLKMSEKEMKRIAEEADDGW